MRFTAVRRAFLNLPFWTFPVLSGGIIYAGSQLIKYRTGVSSYGIVPTQNQTRRPYSIFHAGPYELGQLLKVVPYGVLGTALTESKEFVMRKEKPEGVQVVIVDPAGLHHIHGLPDGAGGAAGAIYQWLGEDLLPPGSPFPESVRADIQAPTHASRYVYGGHPVIHAVGPDLRTERYQGEDGYFVAKRDLAATYCNILKEFAEHLRPELGGWHPDEMNANERQPWGTLKMLPVSGGIFSGKFKKDIPELTAGALIAALGDLPKQHRRAIAARTDAIELCIFDDREFAAFNTELARVLKSVNLAAPTLATTFDSPETSLQFGDNFRVLPISPEEK